MNYRQPGANREYLFWALSHALCAMGVKPSRRTLQPLLRTVTGKACASDTVQAFISRYQISEPVYGWPCIIEARPEPEARFTHDELV